MRTFRKTALSIQEKQEILIQVIRENGPDVAIFGVEKAVAQPLVKKGILHKDTYRYTGGCKFAKREMYEKS